MSSHESDSFEDNNGIESDSSLESGKIETNGDGDDREKNEESDEERSKIRKELSAMPFEKLIELKEELGSKVYNEALFGEECTKRKTQKIDYKRANKNRPREMSSRRQVPFLGNKELKKKEEKLIRDPRFDENSGRYNSKIFKENYSFLNEIREDEITVLKQNLKDAVNEEEKHRIKFLIQRLENKNREEKRNKLKEECLKEEQEEIKKARLDGKQPHFRTKKERKTRELVKQYLELKASGKLEKHLEKRRKKNVAKDRKKIKFD